MKIVKEIPLVEPVISVKNVLLNKEGIVVQVFNNICYILLHNQSAELPAYRRLNSVDKYTGVNTASINIETCMNRCLNHEETPIYYFKTLKEFCEKALKAGWEF